MVSGEVNRNVYINVLNRIKGQQRIEEMTQNLRAMGGQMEATTRSMVAGAQRQEQKVSSLAAKQRRLAETAERVSATSQLVSQAMSSLGFSFTEAGDVVDKAGNQVDDFEQQMASATEQVRPFRFELLSVMFAGMEMVRIVSQLTRKSMQWMQVTEIMSTALGLMFLPFAEKLQKWAIDFLDTVGNMSDGTKQFISTVALLAMVAGTGALALAQMGLALDGMKKIFPGLTNKLRNLTKRVNMLRGTTILISVAWAIKSLSEGKITSAIGAATTAVGLYRGNPWLIGIGIALTVVGDQELMGSIFKVGIKIIDFFLGVGETIGKIIEQALDPTKEINLGNIEFLGDAFKEFDDTLVEMKKNGELASDTISRFANTTAITRLSKEVAKVNRKFKNGEMTLSEARTRMSEIKDKYGTTIKEAENLTRKQINLNSKVQGWVDRTEDSLNKMSQAAEKEVPKLADSMDPVVRKSQLMAGYARDFKDGMKGAKQAGNNFSLPDRVLNSPFFDNDFDLDLPNNFRGFATGGVVDSDGLAMVHQGERVVPAGQTGGGNNITVNVNASLSSDMDVKRMTDKIKSELVRDMERLSGSRKNV